MDLVVDVPPTQIIKRTATALMAKGLFPVVVSRYDLGETRAVWYSTEDASNAVQIDYLYDPCGLGRMGLRSPGLLASADIDVVPPEVMNQAQIIYRWRKSVWKRQADRLRSLRSEAAMLPSEAIVRASEVITGDRRTADEIAGAQFPNRWAGVASHPLLRARRLIDRVRNAVGYWVHVPDESLARDIADVFGRFLPSSGVDGVPTGSVRSRMWFLRTVQPVRLRPGVFVSYGDSPIGIRPELTLPRPGPLPDTLQVVVREMTTRQNCVS